MSKTARKNPIVRWLATFLDKQGNKYSEVLEYTTKAAVKYRLTQDGFEVKNVSKQTKHD